MNITKDDIEDDSKGFVLAILGRSKATNETYIFGCYVYQPWIHGASIQTREADHWEHRLLFQISPRHDFFRGKVGRPPWSVVGDDIHFGYSHAGVGIELSDGLRSARLTHEMGGSAGETIFEASVWRGVFTTDIEVQVIEIWRN